MELALRLRMPRPLSEPSCSLSLPSKFELKMACDALSSFVVAGLMMSPRRSQRLPGGSWEGQPDKGEMVRDVRAMSLCGLVQAPKRSRKTNLGLNSVGSSCVTQGTCNPTSQRSDTSPCGCGTGRPRPHVPSRCLTRD